MQKKSKFESLQKNPSLFLLVGYLIMAMIGTILLLLPISTASGEITNPMDAIFVAVSAICVTGLSPVVTMTHWSTFGHAVILILIQIGGLGIMTATSAIFSLTKHRFSMAERIVISEEKNATGLTGMIKLLKYVLAATFIAEAIGAILLSIQFIPEFGVGKGIWYSVFHAISAFCNAGFDILGEMSVSTYVNNIFATLTISFIIIMGGLGFGVYRDVWKKRNWKRLTLHSKIVLSMTAALLVLGTLAFFGLEYGNPLTLGPLSVPGKIAASFFQSVTTRTAGFFNFDQSSMTNGAALVSIFLMFVGGSPAGTAGGIKTTTLLTAALSTQSEVSRKRDMNIFHRTLSNEAGRKAFAIIVISLSWVLFMTLLLTIFEPQFHFIDVLFEEVSAFGTVGLTRNVTPGLSSIGKSIIALSMIFGKLGPLTMVVAFTKKESNKAFREAEEGILIG